MATRKTQRNHVSGDFITCCITYNFLYSKNLPASLKRKLENVLYGHFRAAPPTPSVLVPGNSDFALQEILVCLLLLKIDDPLSFMPQFQKE